MTADYRAAQARRQSAMLYAVKTGDIDAFTRATHPKMLKAFRDAYIASGDAAAFMELWKKHRGVK